MNRAPTKNVGARPEVCQGVEGAHAGPIREEP
jgi:hypothetical protein